MSKARFNKILVIVGVLIFNSMNNINAYSDNRNASNTYFGCEVGFQFETKKDAARCIKQQRLSLKSPTPCSQSKRSFKHLKEHDFTLAIDKLGQKDLCMVSRSNGISFAPTCEKGFLLLIRSGKDSCINEGKPELIVSPRKKIIR